MTGTTKRGTKTQLMLTGAMAATLSSLGACSSREDDWDANVHAVTDTEVCIDDAGYRVSDWQCDDGHRAYGGGGWYYIRRNSALPYYGDSVTDGKHGIVGSRQPVMGTAYARAPSSTNMTRSAAISRGGFGSSGRSFGGGRS